MTYHVSPHFSRVFTELWYVIEYCQYIYIPKQSALARRYIKLRLLYNFQIVAQVSSALYINFCY